MFKLGVTSRGPFADRTLQLEREHRIWRPFAYSILEEIHSDYSPGDEPLLERLYQSLSAGDRVKKITRRGRFVELDSWLAEEVPQRFANSRPLIVHDIGASNAITSCELFERLARDHDVELHATDYFDRLYLVELRDRGWTVVFDVDHRPLQAVGGRWVISLQQPHPWRHPVNRWVQRHVRRSILPAAQQRLLESTSINANDSSRSSTEDIREVSLFHPACILLSRTDERFCLSRHDLFQPNPFNCHIVRALNVLTTNHFSPEQVLRGIECAAHGMEPDGLLILGRSIDEEDGRLRATAYELDDCRLRPAWRLHGGYEDDALARSVQIRSTMGTAVS